MTLEASPAGRIVIAGGTGFLGLNLARHLSAPDCEVILLSRAPPAGGSRWRHAAWDMRSVGEWAQLLDGATALVNLVGRTVDCITTPDHECDERSAFGYGLAPFVGQAWEEARCRGSRGWRASVSAGRSVAASKGSAGFTRRT